MEACPRLPLVWGRRRPGPLVACSDLGQRGREGVGLSVIASVVNQDSLDPRSVTDDDRRGVEEEPGAAGDTGLGRRTWAASVLGRFGSTLTR